jgi:hypothetical protein
VIALVNLKFKIYNFHLYNYSEILLQVVLYIGFSQIVEFRSIVVVKSMGVTKSLGYMVCYRPHLKSMETSVA